MIHRKQFVACCARIAHSVRIAPCSRSGSDVIIICLSSQSVHNSLTSDCNRIIQRRLRNFNSIFCNFYFYSVIICCNRYRSRSADDLTLRSTPVRGAHTAILIVLHESTNVKHNYPKGVHKMYIFRFILYIALSLLSSYFFNYEQFRRIIRNKICSKQQSRRRGTYDVPHETFFIIISRYRSASCHECLQLCGFPVVCASRSAIFMLCAAWLSRIL